MLTTVVGSYPSIPRQASSIGEKLSNYLGGYDQYKSALELAVQDQVKAGVDIISDGQVRGNMLELFAKELPGVVIDEGIPVIKGKIKPAPYTIGALDLMSTLKTAQKLDPSFKNDSNFLLDGEFQLDFKGVKGIITGPTTLVQSSRIEEVYDNKEDAILDMALALKKEAENLQNAGASIVQIDEPYLSTGIADLKTAKKAIDIVTGNLSLPTSMHVCGSVFEIINEILKFNVNIIDCEFSGQNRNLEAFRNVNLNKKKIGFGCIDTKTDKVESREEVVNTIKEGLNLIGEDNIIIDPDCGMRLRSRDAAYSKLKVMVEAVKWFS